VFVTDKVAEPVETERVLCYSAADGALLWQYSYPCDYRGVGYQAGPRASVVVDNDRAYSLGTMGHLICFDAATGAVRWSRALNEAYDIDMPTWGLSAAPLVVDDMLIVQAGVSDGGCVLGLSKHTGAEVWRCLDDAANYAAPVCIEQGGSVVAVVWTGDRLAGIAPHDGEVLWDVPFRREKSVIGISTPIFHDGHIFVSSFYNGAMLVEVDADRPSAKLVWHRVGKNERQTDALHCCISTPVMLNRHIYGVDSYGELRCLERSTGDRVWQDLTAVKPARWANIHLVQNGDITYMFNEQGELITAGLSPDGYREISRLPLIEPTKAQLNRSGEGVAWAHPAFAYKCIFIRSDEELICASLATP
jgi:outer membrane protein assembly factor BamB